MKQLMEATDAVVFHGMVGEEILADAMGVATLLVYPCTFPETSCMVAIEAQAAGLPIVGRAFGALPETCAGDVGTLVDGDPYDSGWQQLFVDECVAIANDRERWNACNSAGRKATAETYDWNVIVDKWDSYLRGLL